MRKARWIAASFVAFALVAAACGDSKTSNATTTTAKAGTATTAAGGSATTAAAATCKLDKPYKIIGLAEKAAAAVSPPAESGSP